LQERSIETEAGDASGEDPEEVRGSISDIRDEVLPLDPRDPDILRAKRTQRDRRALDDPESRGESAGTV
jgi:hypothetical protein